MGYSSWSSATYSSLKTDYASKKADDIFVNNKTRKIDPLMDPKNMRIRECRDSSSHPNTIPLAFYLDDTGSMRDIPEKLIRFKLGTMIETLMKHGIADPSVLFAAIGDHECDKFPLQIGQFESGTDELNKWLTSVYLEGGGGGNAGESYLLAWYSAARYSSLDCFEKRGKKGYLFTVGDEATLASISAESLKEIFGIGEATDVTAEQLLREAKQMYHVFHIHCVEGSNGNARTVINSWKDLLGQNLILLDDSDNVAETIAATIAVMEGTDKADVLKSLGSAASSVSTALINISNQTGVSSASVIKF